MCNRCQLDDTWQAHPEWMRQELLHLHYEAILDICAIHALAQHGGQVVLFPGSIGSMIMIRCDGICPHPFRWERYTRTWGNGVAIAPYHSQDSSVTIWVSYAPLEASVSTHSWKVVTRAGIQARKQVVELVAIKIWHPSILFLLGRDASDGIVAVYQLPLAS